MQRVNWAVLISGRGSNLAALLDFSDEINLRLVVSSHANAPGLRRARRSGIPTELTPLLDATKKIDWATLDANLRRRQITHIFLLGFMKIVPLKFIELWRGKILNLHPSLLPSYPGLDSIARAYADGAPLGATVHEVTEVVDAGRVLQSRCTSLAGADLAEAEFRVHIAEQQLVRESIFRFQTQTTMRCRS